MDSTSSTDSSTKRSTAGAVGRQGAQLVAAAEEGARLAHIHFNVCPRPSSPIRTAQAARTVGLGYSLSDDNIMIRKTKSL
jgi:hypothetical protein